MRPFETASQDFRISTIDFAKQKVENDRDRTQNSCFAGQNLTNLARAAKEISRKIEVFFKWRVKLARKNMPKLFRKFAFGENGEYLIEAAQ